MSGKGSYGDKRRREKLAKKKGAHDSGKITYPSSEQFFALITANQGDHFDCVAIDKTIYTCRLPKKSILNVKPGILIAITVPDFKRGTETIGCKKNGILCISYTHEQFIELHSTHPDQVPWDPHTGEVAMFSHISRGDKHESSMPPSSIPSDITEAMTAPLSSIAEASASTADLDIDSLIGDI
jgi:hypothetical protein